MQFTESKPLNDIIQRNLLEILNVVLPLHTKEFDLKSNAISTKKLEANFICELKPYFENFTGRVVYTESGVHSFTVDSIDNYTHLTRAVPVAKRNPEKVTFELTRGAVNVYNYSYTETPNNAGAIYC